MTRTSYEWNTTCMEGDARPDELMDDGRDVAGPRPVRIVFVAAVREFS